MTDDARWLAQAVDLAVCSDEGLVEVAAAQERAITRLTFAGDRQLVEITERDLPRQMGFRSVPNFFNQRLRISNPQRRRTQLAATASMRARVPESASPETVSCRQWRWKAERTISGRPGSTG